MIPHIGMNEIEGAELEELVSTFFPPIIAFFK
jgi:hypothetical protein